MVQFQFAPEFCVQRRRACRNFWINDDRRDVQSIEIGPAISALYLCYELLQASRAKIVAHAFNMLPAKIKSGGFIPEDKNTAPPLTIARQRLDNRLALAVTPHVLRQINLFAARMKSGADRECANSTDTAHRTRATKGNHKCNRNLRPRRIFRH